MTLDTSSDHRKITDRFKAAGAALPSVRLLEHDKNGVFDRKLWDHFSKHHIHGLIAGTVYKGKAFSALRTCLAFEGLAAGCANNGLIFSSIAHLIAGVLPIQIHGSDAQKKKYLQQAASGKFILANAITELNAGSDVFNMEATAVRKNGGYILNGKKLFVTNAPVADAFIVYALTDQKKGFFGGISAFIVKANTKGVKRSPVKEKMGLRTAQMADVTFKDVGLEEKHLLGREGAGAGIFNASMQWERVVVSAFLCGQLERVLSGSLVYLKKRKAGTKRLFELQSVQHTAAGIKTALTAGRSLLHTAAAAIDNGDKNGIALSSMAKLFVSEHVVESIQKLQALHGGYGYLTESGLEREYRDACASLIYSGTSSIQKNIIAGSL